MKATTLLFLAALGLALALFPLAPLERLALAGLGSLLVCPPETRRTVLALAGLAGIVLACL